MTRLDATSEPSMEDILASIRKIIAEDPPGSRPAPAPSAPVASHPSTQQSTLRAPERDRFSPFTGRGEDTPAQSSFPSPEPYLKPQKPSSPAFGNEPFFTSKPASSADASYPDASTASSRIEPSFDAFSSPAASAAEDVAEGAPAPAKAESLSVDAQLSDLLGETAAVVIQQASAPKASLGFGDRMAGRSAQSPAAVASSADVPMQMTPAASAPAHATDARPGFTVSRDGFVAGATEPAEPDPFEFDLGPSPFQTKQADTAAAPIAAPAPAPTGNSLTARMSASSLERIAAPSVAATVANPNSLDNRTETAEAAESAAVAAEPEAPDADATARAASMEAPSVAATLAPAPTDEPLKSEPIGRFIPANASVEQPKPVDRDVLEVGAPQNADSAPIEVVRVAPEADTQPQAASHSSSTALAVHHADGQMRTMEETVAELLRPMLKSWLAENMPRIVERALRRELTEQMLLGKKDAAE